MRMRRFLTVAAAVAVAWPSIAPAGAVGPSGTVTDLGRVKTIVDDGVPAGWAYSGRDCGYSETTRDTPIQALWVGCDTVYTSPSNPNPTLLTSTAYRGTFTPGQAPTGLIEQGPLGTFQQFVPPPPMPSPACPSNAYRAPWTTGMNRIPGTDIILISYGVFCVSTNAAGNPVNTLRGFGIAEYNASNRTFVGNTPYIKSGNPLNGMWSMTSPVIDARTMTLYMYSSDCTQPPVFATCPAGETRVARVALGTPTQALANRPWRNAANYEWAMTPSPLTPPTWAVSAAGGDNVVLGARPLGAHVEEFPVLGTDRFVMIEQYSLTGHFSVYRAPDPWGPWTLQGSDKVPCTTVGNSFCRALIGHPELSTGSDLVLSFFHPGDDHVRAAKVPW